jgi:EAL domain-containing protein (putative c-di-GMP-specific phosphodiesterase class I)
MEPLEAEERDTGDGCSESLERLLALVGEEFGATVTLVVERGSPPAATSAGGALVLPVEGRLRRYGELRIAGAAGADEQQRHLAQVIARLVGERLDLQGRDRVHFLERAARIRAVLEREDIAIVYQPIVELQSRRVVGMEALSRFPRSRLAPPDRWFREAAGVGFGVDLEVLAVRHALQALRSLPADQYLSVNVSPSVAGTRLLASHLGDQPLDRLVFEITEHAQIDDYDQLNRALRPLRERGLRVAVDDAGAGFASLRHILRVMPDIIKLDMSLTRDIDHDSVLRALSYSIASFGAAIEASVVAEGVESERELDALRFLNISYGQGFHLGRPATLTRSTTA